MTVWKLLWRPYNNHHIIVVIVISITTLKMITLVIIRTITITTNPIVYVQSCTRMAITKNNSGNNHNSEQLFEWRNDDGVEMM